jgi:hypothetical protein
MSEPADADRRAPASREGSQPRGVYLLLLVPLVGVLIPPVYNRHDPTLIGIPFFYWYLLAWVPVTVVCLAIVSRSAMEGR